MKLGELEAPGIYQGDCRELLRKLPDESVQLCVTSPPYWGLRVYEGEQGLVWGATDGCEHRWRDVERLSTPGGPPSLDKAKVGATKAGVQRGIVREAFCELCGVWKGPFGNEPTYQMYVDHTMEIMAEIWRVLRSDGLLFWNIGDSYVTVSYEQSGRPTDPKHNGRKTRGPNRVPQSGLKNKDLALIPHRVALAAQEAGWWVRSDIIWHKGNAMPESVQDRPTRCHEHILMLTKSQKYYWDAGAVRESHEMRPQRRPAGRQADRTPRPP